MQTAQDSRVQLVRTPAAEGTDAVTAQTIGLMCGHISAACEDPVIKLAAQHALKNFGQDTNDPAMRAWAAFWFVKHQVKFVVDEAPMMRLGEPNQQDLLISPSVLIRMDKPQEDCDGFTMLGAALLKCLGVPFVIVTIAASADDPSRWSHVFLMAHTGKQWLPLDMSHGSGPGWIVPASHTYRWQCWNQSGEPVDIQRPGKYGLHGFVGLGQGICTDDEGNIIACPTDAASIASQTTTTSSSTPLTAAEQAFLYGTSNTSASTSAATAFPSTGFNWTSFLNTLTNDAASVAKTSITNASITNGSLALSGVFSSLLPIVGIGLVAWVVIGALGNRK